MAAFKGGVVMQLKVRLIDSSHVFLLLQAGQIALQCRQLEVLAVVEGQDRDSVAELQAKRASRVVNQNNIAQLSVDPRKVFHVQAVEVDAVFAVQPVMEELFLWVDLVENSISIVLVARSEDHDLPLFADLLEES